MKKTLVAAALTILSIGAASAAPSSVEHFSDIRIAVSPGVAANVPVALAAEFNQVVDFVARDRAGVIEAMQRGEADCAVVAKEDAVLMLGQSAGDTRTVLTLAEEKTDNQFYVLTCSSAAQNDHPASFKALTATVSTTLQQLHGIKFDGKTHAKAAKAAASTTLERTGLPADGLTQLAEQVATSNTTNQFKGIAWGSGKVFN